MERDPHFLSTLEQLLEEECRVHQEYILLLEREESALTKLNSDEVSELSAKREKLASRMEQLQEQRAKFMLRFPDAEHSKLSELVVKHCEPRDAKRLTPLVAKLKQLITRSRALGSEVGQIANFSLSMIDGTLSILWSATQNVTQAYSRKGVLSETYQSVKTGELKQA